MNSDNIAALLEEAREHHQSGRLTDAENACRIILRRDAGNPETLHRLGLLARARGRKDKALELLARAANLRKDSAELQGDLGQTLAGYRDFAAAIHRLELALSLDPARQSDYLCLAGVYGEIGRSDKMLETCDRAMEHAEEDQPIASRIASALMTQGKIAEALAIWRRVVEQKPDHQAHSALLFCLHYVADQSPEDIFEEHRKFSGLHESPFLASRPEPLNDPNPDRVRVGYVSADFRMHPVAQFLAPVLARHDGSRFEVFCYSSTPAFDSRTAEFQKMAGHRWRDIRACNDDQAADLIRRDGIDILVDTSGHTGGNRMVVFARKPAPVQVTWLGYPDTTGLKSIDYRITDRYADPMGMTESLHSEELLRLPSFLCYEAPEYIPDPAPPPCLKNGFITFGSFNNFMKTGPETIETWAEILKSVAGSKLILKHRGASDVEARDAFPGFFERHGIHRNRIQITAQMPSHKLHLDSYREMDIALDPFPYNGTTTSCETLAMGVPMVALAGQTHVSRVGCSLLTHLGLTDWIASTREQYVQLAVAKAASPEELAAIRSLMRERVALSELGNPRRFTQALEQSYREIWKNWCTDRSGRISSARR